MTEADVGGQYADQRDVIYVLRTAQQHHVQLSFMADQKANIIIGAALVAITLIYREATTAGSASFPLLLLSLGMATAALFAILAVAPIFRTRKSEARRPNLLFFGTYTRIPEAEFIDSLIDELNGNEAARRMLLRDIHQIGVVLRRKYFLLRCSYIALLLGVAAFTATAVAAAVG